MRKLIAVFVALMLCATFVAAGRTQNVRLCEKDTTTWDCQKGVKEYVVNDKGGRKAVKYASGYTRYKGGDALNLFLSTSRLNKEQEYQVALVGQGNTPTDTLLASACPNPNSGAIWECGLWGDQGFYNFHIGQLGSLRNNRYVMHDKFSVELPAGEYNDVKFLVKQNSAPWDTYLYETKTLNFVIE